MTTDTWTPALDMWIKAALVEIEDDAPIWDALVAEMGAPVVNLFHVAAINGYVCIGCCTDIDADRDPSPGEADSFCALCFYAEAPDEVSS